MDYFYSIFDNVRYFCSSFNPSILTGAIDVIVVEQPDGRYLSTPFHVRFGKYSVLNNTDKYVDIRINGREVGIKMKLGVGGVASFVEETDIGERVPRYLVTSPVRNGSRDPQSCRTYFVDLPRNKEGCVIKRRRSSEIVGAMNRPSLKFVRQRLRKRGILRGSYSDTELIRQKRQIRAPFNIKPIRSEWKWGEIPLTPSPTPVSLRRSRSKTDRASTPPAPLPLPRASSTAATLLRTASELSVPTLDVELVQLVSANYKRSLRLSDTQLRSLGLVYGANNAHFSVTTRFQGTARCACQIYLIRWSHQLVISDIDGTITKSDVLGHVFAAVGGTWAHSGVAELFARISSNGYQMIYLSSRAIGMSSQTRQFLKTLRQGSQTLPDGPVLLSPSSVLVALRREVIQRQPEKFKISCLIDLKNLFPNRQPFFAGFGNRITDVKSYEAVHVPLQRIFIINPLGVVVRADGSFFTTDYSSMAASTADLMFPPLHWSAFERVSKLTRDFIRPEDKFYTCFAWDNLDRVKNGYYERLANADALADYQRRCVVAADRRQKAKQTAANNVK